MIRLLMILCLLIAIGCKSDSRKYVEGTSTAIGAYLPYNGSLIGVEVLNYLSGCKVSASSNQSFKVDREYTATNDYLFGMVKTVERSKTKVEVKND